MSLGLRIAVRKLLQKFGKPNMKIISKIECDYGVQYAHDILEISDGIMVARGDLGVEVDFAEIPLIQKELINECKVHGKISITATQMMESMTASSRPTRAEISDVANAICDGTTAIMLSGETSAGKHPALVVKTMARIATKMLIMKFPSRLPRARRRSGRRSGESVSIPHDAVS